MTMSDVEPTNSPDTCCPGKKARALAASDGTPGAQPTAATSDNARVMMDHDMRAQKMRHDAMKTIDNKSVDAPKYAVDQAVPYLAENFDTFAGQDGNVTRQDFERVAKDQGSSQEARATAQYFLANPSAFAYADVGSGSGKTDGTIARADAQAVNQALFSAGGSNGAVAGVEGKIDTQAEAVRVLGKYAGWAETASGKGGRDGDVSNADLKALIAEPGVPADLRQAARVILEGRESAQPTQPSGGTGTLGGAAGSIANNGGSGGSGSPGSLSGHAGGGSIGNGGPGAIRAR